jgi:hypothetical protein
MSINFRHTLHPAHHVPVKFRGVSERLGTKSLFSNTLALASNPLCSLLRAHAQILGKKFPNYVFPRIAREKHSLLRLGARNKMSGVGKDLLLCCETVPDICRATEFTLR